MQQREDMQRKHSAAKSLAHFSPDGKGTCALSPLQVGDASRGLRWPRAMRQTVELESNALCWLDVGGGLSAGKKHLDLMRRGMEQGYLAVLLLADAIQAQASTRKRPHQRARWRT